MTNRIPSPALLLVCLLTVGGLTPKLAHAQADADVVRAVELAEESYRNGRPDYILIRRALAQAEATDDLRLRARANFVQARADSAANRRSKAGPYFRRAEQLVAQADSIDFAAELARAEAEAATAAETEAAALAERNRVAEELAEQESEAAGTLWTTIAGFVIGIGLLLFIFLATVRKLRGDVKKARAAQAEADEGFAQARAQMTGSAKVSMQRLRNLLKHYRALVPAGAAGSGTSLIAAHESAMQSMVQSSFDSGDSFEMAAESFFDKFQARLVELTAPNGGRLEVESMPLRLPLDQSIPFTLLFTELAAYAFANGSSVVKTTLTKEGTTATLSVIDESGRQSPVAVDAPALKYARQLAAELGGKLDTVGADGSTTRLKFTAVSGRTGGAAAM